MDDKKFRPEYTREECEQEIAWFEARMDKLPASLQINASTYAPDLRLTVTNLIRTLRANKVMVTFAGYLSTLLQIKERLLEQGMA